MLAHTVFLLLIGLAGAIVARRIKMPGGTFLGAMLSTGIVSLLAPDSQPLPEVIRSVALVLLGISIGASVDREALLSLRRVLPWAAAMIGILIAASVGLGWLVYTHQALDVSAATILFGIMPGGASGLSAAAYDLGAEPSIVASLHSVRQFIVFGLLPLLLRWLARPGWNKLKEAKE
ncbi:MAG: AbrB family transcriptional regulator [Chloroflexi bacterium]|nr:AbrB family transcriptional regulator [Chloroflexota bacterium]